MPMTSTERRLRAQLAALERTARGEDPSERTRKAREAAARRFEDQVDPDRVLPTEERQRRAEAARMAHMTRMAYRSAKLRRERREAEDAS